MIGKREVIHLTKGNNLYVLYPSQFIKYDEILISYLPLLMMIGTRGGNPSYNGR